MAVTCSRFVALALVLVLSAARECVRTDVLDESGVWTLGDCSALKVELHAIGGVCCNSFVLCSGLPNRSAPSRWRSPDGATSARIIILSTHTVTSWWIGHVGV